MNTLKVERELAKKYNYKPLDKYMSQRYREYYLSNIPDFISVKGDTRTLYTTKFTPICSSYDRVVIGDYGAFIEFSEASAASKITVKKGQEYRINDERYSGKVKYEWLTIQDGSFVKIYKQKRTVAYADYVVGKYYVSVHEVAIPERSIEMRYHTDGQLAGLWTANVKVYANGSEMKYQSDLEKNKYTSEELYKFLKQIEEKYNEGRNP